MSKTASLLFAVTSVLWMCATAVLLSYNAWLAAACGILACANIAAGFIFKARGKRRRS